MDKITGSRSNLVVVIGCVVALIGSFLAWGTVSAGGLSVSVSGTDGGDGTLTLLLAVATAVAAILLMGRGRARQISIIVGAALILLIAIINIVDISSLGSDFGDAVDVSIGLGLWLVLLGGLAAAVGAFLPESDAA